MAVNREKRINLFNPFSIIIASILSTTIAFFDVLYMNLILIAISIIVYSIVTFKGLKKQLIYLALLYLLEYILYKYFSSTFLFSYLILVVIISLKFYPMIIFYNSLLHFSSSEIVSSFRNLKFPEEISIFITIFFRYMPELKERIKDISEGAKIRGIRFSLLHPLKSFEYIIVPLLYKGLHISESITASMITKAGRYEIKKTNYRNIKMKAQDYILILIMLVLLGGVLWMK